MNHKLFQGTIDHTGFVVPDIDEAVTFFTEVLHFELLFQPEPLSFSDDRLKRSFGVHAQSSVEGAAFLQYGGKKIELVQWTDPEQQAGPKPADIGTAHLAISVTDLDRAYTYFESVQVYQFGNLARSDFSILQLHGGLRFKLSSHHSGLLKRRLPTT